MLKQCLAHTHTNPPKVKPLDEVTDVECSRLKKIELKGQEGMNNRDEMTWRQKKAREGERRQRYTKWTAEDWIDVNGDTENGENGAREGGEGERERSVLGLNSSHITSSC